MGSIAHFRQAMLDSDHLQKLDAYYESHGGAHPPVDPRLEGSQAARAKKLPSGGKPTPATRFTGRSTWQRSSGRPR